MITNSVSLTINMDTMSSSNVFSTLIYVIRCNVLLFRINKISLFNKKKNKKNNFLMFDPLIKSLKKKIKHK